MSMLTSTQIIVHKEEEESIMENKELDKILEKAEVLIEALPYIQKFNRKIIVVKYGGSAMSNEELQKNSAVGCWRIAIFSGI